MTDKRTGLNWKRCSEGQNWSGSTCTGTGTASTHTHAGGGTGLGQSRQHQPKRHRLVPAQCERAASLADKGCQHPAIDGTAFPVTPSNLFWSLSPSVGSSNGAWDVNFYNGYVNYGLNRSNSCHVRLVRAS